MEYLEIIKKLVEKFEEIGNDHDSSEYNFWHIIAALRGPDLNIGYDDEGYDDKYDEHSKIKASTTVKIRKFLFELAGEDWTEESYSVHESDELFTFRFIKESCGDHFAGHLNLAERAIQELFDPDFKIIADEDDE